MHFDQGAYVAIASHDDNIIDWVKVFAEQSRIGKQEFEFQMLYGADERSGRACAGRLPYPVLYALRNDVVPDFTRRLAEKPANLMMVLKNMFK